MIQNTKDPHTRLSILKYFLYFILASAWRDVSQHEDIWQVNWPHYERERVLQAVYNDVLSFCFYCPLNIDSTKSKNDHKFKFW